jgi:hypothetical protein
MKKFFASILLLFMMVIYVHSALHTYNFFVNPEYEHYKIVSQEIYGYRDGGKYPSYHVVVKVDKGGTIFYQQANRAEIERGYVSKQIDKNKYYTFLGFITFALSILALICGCAYLFWKMLMFIFNTLFKEYFNSN